MSRCKCGGLLALMSEAAGDCDLYFCQCALCGWTSGQKYESRDAAIYAAFPPPGDLTRQVILDMIVKARQDRVDALGSDWMAREDDHLDGSLAIAAGCYCLADDARLDNLHETRPAKWPFPKEEWSPSPDDPLAELISAAVYLLAEAERVVRAYPMYENLRR